MSARDELRLMVEARVHRCSAQVELAQLAERLVDAIEEANAALHVGPRVASWERIRNAQAILERALKGAEDDQGRCTRKPPAPEP